MSASQVFDSDPGLRPGSSVMMLLIHLPAPPERTNPVFFYCFITHNAFV